MIHDTQSAQILQEQDRRNIYAIMKTMCPPGYHHSGFVVTHALWHMMYMYIIYISISISVYIYIYIYIIYSQYIYIIYSATETKYFHFKNVISFFLDIFDIYIYIYI